MRNEATHHCSGRDALVAAGWASITLAVFQAVISTSTEWSLYWGAPPEYAAKPVELLVMGEVVALLFALFGLYAFSGAGSFRRLPFTKTVLVAVATVFILRGLVFLPQIAIMAGYLHARTDVPVRMLASSFVSLGIGLLYLYGVCKCWRMEIALG
jgi:hypothetical protein